ncbi:hypothetical protein ETB97_003169 [Aspergillus alliaceus]|uniref:Uncharacterized protein n=1 Tax=Petromyces alliaceus TaxID=209559 RepID=A0A8H6A250_PETAA|nr:hypothetical protein ETB97_003169 [Aspergillus burnettii]
MDSWQCWISTHAECDQVGQPVVFGHRIDMVGVVFGTSRGGMAGNGEPTPRHYVTFALPAHKKRLRSLLQKREFTSYRNTLAPQN